MKNTKKTRGFCPVNIQGVLLCMVMVLMVTSMLPVQASAAARKYKLSTKKITVYVGGESASLDVIWTSKEKKGHWYVCGAGETKNVKIKWTSSNKKVATVSQKVTPERGARCRIKPKKTGKTTITAKFGKKKLKCKVTVVNPFLNKTDVTLEKGENVIVQLTGAKAKKFTSSSPKVATVSKSRFYPNAGSVTAVSSGSAVISVRGSDKKVYKCRVTVVDSKDDDSDEDPKVTPMPSPTWNCNINGHSFDAGRVVSGPSCTRGSEIIQTCRICGMEYHTYGNDALGHQESDWIVDQEATCTHRGKSHKECTRCGMTLDINYDFPEAKGHVESDWIVDEEPTCINHGYRHIECTVCHQVIRRERIEATGHTESDWIIEKEPTSGENGARYKECTKCKKVLKYEEILAE